MPDYVVALKDQIASLQAEIRGQQKGTDKRFGQMQGDIKRILELKDQGLDESQIQRELWIDRQMNPPVEQNPPVTPTPGTGSANIGFDVENIVRDFFEPNDPSLASLRQKHGGNQAEFLKEAMRLGIEKAKTPNPSPASILSQTGQAYTGLTPEQADERLQQLNDLYKNFSKNRPAIQQLEKELETAGILQKR